MTQELNELQQMHSENFYEKVANKLLFLSASAIKLLIQDPKNYFKKYVLGEQDVSRSKKMDIGRLVHCMTLEPEKLGDNFVNMGVAIPTESTLKCIQYLLGLNGSSVVLDDYADEILDYLVEVNLHQSLVDDKKAPFKTGNSKRLEKVITDSAREYFELMMEAREKTIVDAPMWDTAYEKSKALLENKHIAELFKMTNPDDQVHFELELSLNVEGLDYGLKGIIDAMKISPTNKRVYITDIKTHGGLLEDFPKSAERYDYWTQGATYKLMVEQLLRDNNIEDYDIVFIFAVVDSKDNTYPFYVGEETLDRWVSAFTTIINKEIKYHITSKDFTLPYKFANNLISL